MPVLTSANLPNTKHAENVLFSFLVRCALCRFCGMDDRFLARSSACGIWNLLSLPHPLELLPIQVSFFSACFVDRLFLIDLLFKWFLIDAVI